MGLGYDEDLCKLNFAVSHKFRHSLSTVLQERKALFMEMLVDFKSLDTLILSNYIDPNVTILRRRGQTKQSNQLMSLYILKERSRLPDAKYLKILKLVIPTTKKLYKDFFKYHSIKSLDDVEIHITGTGLYKWIDVAGVDMCLKDFCLQKNKTARLTFADEDLVDSTEIDLFSQVLNCGHGEKRICKQLSCSQS